MIFSDDSATAIIQEERVYAWKGLDSTRRRIVDAVGPCVRRKARTAQQA